MPADKKPRIPRKELESLVMQAHECRLAFNNAEAIRLLMECYERSVGYNYRHGVGLALLGLGEILYYRRRAYRDAFRFFQRAKAMAPGGWYITAHEFWQDSRRRLMERDQWEEALYKDRTPPDELIAEFKRKYGHTGRRVAPDERGTD